MTSRISIFDAQTIDSLRWPADQWGRLARGHLLPLIKHGPLRYVDNVSAAMLALVVDDVVLPIVLSHARPGNSNVCSPYSHYVQYAGEEIRRLPNRLLSRALSGLLSSMGTLLKTGELDKVVYVNNWLMTTNPCHELSRDQLSAITASLTDRYPGHAIVFRSIDAYAHPHLLRALRASGCRTVAARTVYYLPHRTIPASNRNNTTRDMNLLAHSPYDVVDTHQLSDADVPRITQLYRALYLRRYTPLNPQFNERFFSHALRAGLFTFKALRRNGTIDAFVSCYEWGGLLFGVALGYDTRLPRRLGLYRQAFALFMEEARQRGLLLHMSAGVGSFKIHRGGIPVIELDAVYDRHLPWRRRIPWHCLRASFNGPLFKRLSATV